MELRHHKAKLHLPKHKTVNLCNIKCQSNINNFPAYINHRRVTHKKLYRIFKNSQTDQKKGKLRILINLAQ